MCIITLTDDGIYCELNLKDCITYALPPGTTNKTLLPLKNSLLSHTDTDYTANNRTVHINGESNTSKLLIDSPNTVKEIHNVSTIGYYWTHEKHSFISTYMLDAYDTEILSLFDCVYKVSAETVS